MRIFLVETVHFTLKTKLEMQEIGKVHISQVFFQTSCKIVKISPKQITTLKTTIQSALSNFIDLDSGAVFLVSIL